MLTGENTREEKIVSGCAQILFELDRPTFTSTLVRMLPERIGFAVSPHVINSLLSKWRSEFAHDGDHPLQWYLKGDAEELRNLTPPWSPLPDRRGWYGPVEPHKWQLKALKAWDAQGKRGVIEAATGTGKSMVGIQALFRCISEGGRVLVLVPSVVLMFQWAKMLKPAIGQHNIELIGGGRKGSVESNKPLVIGVVHSISKESWRLDGLFQLIVADECHRYGANSFQWALDESIPERLGLTATLERLDDGVDEVLSPYFSEVACKYDLAAALRDQVIAPFRLAMVSVELERSEIEEYRKHGKTMKRAMDTLVNNYGYRRKPIGEFTSRASRAVKEGGADWNETQAAKEYMASMKRRQEILSETPAKRKVIPSIGAAIDKRHKSLFFTQTIGSSDLIAAQLRSSGIQAMAYHTEVDQSGREEILEGFLEGFVKCLVAVRQLDEGVDVPDARVGVVVSASRTQRQMIQRVGRVLRKKPDGGEARFVVLFAEDTAEDPRRAGNEDGYLEWILKGAGETIWLDGSADISRELAKFLKF